MRHLVEAGLVASLALGFSACGDKPEPEGINLVAQREEGILNEPNAISDPKDTIRVLRIGEEVLATCFYYSPTLMIDSVRVQGNTDGYVFVDRALEESTVRVDTFDVPASVLRNNLPECS